jgi:hypothetical protein
LDQGVRRTDWELLVWSKALEWSKALKTDESYFEGADVERQRARS